MFNQHNKKNEQLWRGALTFLKHLDHFADFSPNPGGRCQGQKEVKNGIFAPKSSFFKVFDFKRVLNQPRRKNDCLWATKLLPLDKLNQLPNFSLTNFSKRCRLGPKFFFAYFDLHWLLNQPKKTNELHWGRNLTLFQYLDQFLDFFEN